MKENIFKGIFAAGLASLSAYFGVIATPIIILLCVIVADYITGMSKAWITKQISSRIGIIGIIKKISYLFVVCAGMVVDWVISSALSGIGVDFTNSFSFGLVVVIWLIINELVSILENLRAVGVPLPEFLVMIIGKLKQTVNEKTGADTTAPETEEE